MTVRDTLEEKLKKALNPTNIEVIDESHKHAGHAGARPEGETHFHVNMTSEVFTGKTRIAQQRLVYGTLKEELDGPVHALSLKLKGC